MHWKVFSKMLLKNLINVFLKSPVFLSAVAPLQTRACDLVKAGIKTMNLQYSPDCAVCGTASKQSSKTVKDALKQ